MPKSSLLSPGPSSQTTVMPAHARPAAIMDTAPRTRTDRLDCGSWRSLDRTTDQLVHLVGLFIDGELEQYALTYFVRAAFSVASTESPQRYFTPIQPFA